jgi:hypothetical protein
VSSPFYDPSHELTSYVESYQQSNNIGLLLDQLRALAKRTTPELLKEASQPFRDMPEVISPLYERIVADLPGDAQAMVVLANSYWLAGRGPDAVEPLAARAKSVDPSNRGAWHLWALAQPNLRKRVDRWLAVTQQFPADQLARAALADNAVSLANDEDDFAALALAITTYQGLLNEATHPAQRQALRETIEKLQKWRR